MDSLPYTKVAVIEDMIEAQVLESMLIEQAVPYRIRSFHDTAYDGLFQLQKGWGEVYAPPSCHNTVADLIGEIRSQSTSAKGLDDYV